MRIIDVWQNDRYAQIVIELLESKILNGQFKPNEENISGRWRVLGKILAKQNNLNAELVSIDAGISDFPGWLGTRQQFQLTYKKDDK